MTIHDSQNLAARGQIELAYHRIRQAPAELNWSQHFELLHEEWE